MDLTNVNGKVAYEKVNSQLNQKLLDAVSVVATTVEVADTAVRDYINNKEKIGHVIDPAAPYPLITVQPDTVTLDIVHANDGYDQYAFQNADVARSLAGLAGKFGGL